MQNMRTERIIFYFLLKFFFYCAKINVNLLIVRGGFMTYSTLNQMLKNVEKEAKDRLSAMSEEEITEKAEKYKKQSLIFNVTFAIISIVVFSIILACLPLIYEGEPVDTWVLLVGIFAAIVTTSIFPIIWFIDSKKAPSQLALKVLMKEMQKTALSKLQQTSSNIIENNFDVTKMIDILTAGWSTQKLLVDNKNGKFIYQKGKTYSKSYKFSDIISYEIYENGNSKVQGRAGSALIGGAFFGLGGAIVGSSRSRNINEKCTQLKLLIRLNDLDCPQIDITYVNNVGIDKSSSMYQNMMSNLQSVCSVLEFMVNNKTLQQSETKQPETKIEQTKKEQLQELKEMFDEGLITQEDFDTKKKQILGL